MEEADILLFFEAALEVELRRRGVWIRYNMLDPKVQIQYDEGRPYFIILVPKKKVKVLETDFDLYEAAISGASIMTRKFAVPRELASC